jgi:hypothetical protein
MSKRPGPEAAVLKSVVAYAEARGCVVIRVNSGLTVLRNGDGTRRVIRGGRPGTSDLILCVPTGRDRGYRAEFVACEVKAPALPKVRRDGRPTEAQRAFLHAVRMAGGCGEVVRSVDDLREILDHLGCPAVGAGVTR